MGTGAQGPTTPPPDWYPDPKDPALLRYWDGATWTEHTSPAQPAQTAEPAQAAQATQTAQSTPAKKGLSGLAIGLIVGGSVIVAAVVAIALIAVMAAPQVAEQQRLAYDAAAKADVSTLAKEIATYYLDHDGLPPEITVQGDRFHIDLGESDLDVGKSAGVVYGDTTGTGFTDWCVWLEHPEGELKTFEYSFERGLQNGSC